MGVFSLIISEITQTYRQKDSVSIKIKQSGTLQNCSVERLNSWITVAEIICHLMNSSKLKIPITSKVSRRTFSNTVYCS